MVKPTPKTSVERWLAKYQPVADPHQNVLAKRFKQKARQLLPAHFPNAGLMLRYVRRLHAPEEQLQCVRALYNDYRAFVLRFKDDCMPTNKANVKKERDFTEPAVDGGWGVTWPPREWE